MSSKFCVARCPTREQAAAQMLQRLHDEGRAVPGVSALICPDILPAWLDEGSFRKGQSFARRYAIR